MSNQDVFDVVAVRPSTICITQNVGELCRLGEAESVDRGLGEIHPAEDVNVEVAEAGEEAEVPRVLPTPLIPSKYLVPTLSRGIWT